MIVSEKGNEQCIILAKHLTYAAVTTGHRDQNSPIFHQEFHAFFAYAPHWELFEDGDQSAWIQVKFSDRNMSFCLVQSMDHGQSSIDSYSKYDWFLDFRHPKIISHALLVHPHSITNSLFMQCSSFFVRALPVICLFGRFTTSSSHIINRNALIQHIILSNQMFSSYILVLLFLFVVFCLLATHTCCCCCCFCSVASL